MQPPQKWPSADLSSYPLRYSLVLEQLPGHGLVGDAPPGHRIIPDFDTKEGSPPWPGDGSLCLFDEQLETVLDEPGHARHDPSAGPFAADVEERSLEVTIANLMEVQLSLTLLRKCGSKVSPRNDGCPAVIPAKSGGSRRSWSSQHW